MLDIKGISPSYCTHKILIEDDYKPVIQPQRRLNSKVQDVVKNEIVKLLDFGLIYPISNSSYVSPVYVVLKKGGMTVVLKDNNELFPSRIVTRWRVCIDYCKLKDATRKDHFPLPFIDQMLEHLLFQILFAPEDQEKTTLTYPYGRRLYGSIHERILEDEITNEFLDEHLMILKAKLNVDEPCLEHYHYGPTRGHYSVSITERKVYESGFFWPSIFKDAKDYVICDACQRSRNISSRSEMPQNNIQNWSKKLDDALWAFRTAFKTPTGCTPFRLVYGKACHLPMEIEYKAYWVLKQCNMDLIAAIKNRFIELNELMELRDEAYENT
nr:putative reverse transcriptase domain-containing protein [Tanacetum cinerariifolium]